MSKLRSFSLLEMFNTSNIVCVNTESDEFIIQGFEDGTISFITEAQETRIQEHLHDCPVTSIVLIDEGVRILRLASADTSGRLVVGNIVWQADNHEDVSFTIDFEHNLGQHVCQITSCYPKHACLCLVTDVGTLFSINWRTKEVRQTQLFTKEISHKDFGLLYNRRSDLLYLSLLTKVGLKLLVLDFFSLSLTRICGISKLPCLTSAGWTRMSWYCDRFILCYASNFIAIFDPVALCSLHVMEFPSTDELLFLTAKYADVSLYFKSQSSTTAMKTQQLSGKELLFVVVPEPVAIEIPEPASPEIQEAEEVKENAVEKPPTPRIYEHSTGQPESTTATVHSDESLPPIDTADCLPKLPEWIERVPDNVPPLLLGQYASDSNLPAIQSSRFSATDQASKGREHASSFSHPPANAEGVENVTTRRDSADHASIRPAISTDDRLMKLFFPADYGNECPFPSQPVSSDENVEAKPKESTFQENLPESKIAIPAVNFLDFWPIWLDMPLLWTSSITSSGPAAAIFGTLRPTSVSLSKHHIYVTDSASRLSFASLDCKTVRWQIAVDASPADQISSSPQGDILWLLRSGSVFAAQMTSASAPVGTRWERILLDVSFIHVTEGRAFYIRRDGALMMQSGLSSRRPSYVSVQLHTPFRLKSVVVAGLDMWGHCADGRVVFCNRLLAHSSTATKSHTQVCRRDEAYAGDWQVDKSCPPDACRVASIFAGPFNTIMVADELCRIWMRRSTTSPAVCLADHLLPLSKSKCPDEWWLVPLPRSHDGTPENANFHKTWPLYVAACRDTVVFTAPSMGSGALQLYLNKGHLLGQQLRRVRPNGSALTTRWRSVHFVEPHFSYNVDEGDEQQQQIRNDRSMSTTTSSTTKRQYSRISPTFAWFVGETNDLLRLDFATLNAVSPGPIVVRSGSVKMVSVGQHVSWILLNDGNVWACHHDAEADRWAQLDLAQLSDENLPIVDVAVGPRLVWILCANGTLFFRIGVNILSSSSTVSQPALCRLTDDATSVVSDVTLRRIYASPSCEWMIFALPAIGSQTARPAKAKAQPVPHDAYNMAPLARIGVTTDVPIGAMWHPVIGGPPMADLALSATAGLFGVPDLSRVSDGSRSTSSRLSPSPPPPQTGSTVYWRAGVRQSDPTGSYWRKVIDGVTQVSAADSHAQLCLIGSDGSMYVHAVCCFAAGLGQQEESHGSAHRSSVSEQPSEKELAGWEMI